MCNRIYAHAGCFEKPATSRNLSELFFLIFDVVLVVCLA